MAKEKISGNNSDFKRRIFCVMAITAGLANLLGFISNAVLFGFTSGTIICGVCAAVVISAGVFGIAANRIEIAMYLILALVNLFEFPFLVIAYGGSTMVYMILGLLGIMAFVTTKRRFIFVGLTVLFDLTAFIIRYYFPELSQSTENMKGALICSFFIVFAAVISVLNVLITQYERQNKELTAMSDKLHAMANTDPLTGIYNRRYLMKYLEEMLNNMSGKTACAMLLDIDYFKKANDTYGHIFGDKVLVEFAKTMKNNVNDKGIVARFGGEEFMIIFNTDNKTEIRGIMKAISNGFAEFSQREKGIELTFSGGAEFFDSSATMTEIFSTADKKLYTAKENGRNRIIFETEE